MISFLTVRIRGSACAGSKAAIEGVNSRYAIDAFCIKSGNCDSSIARDAETSMSPCAHAEKISKMEMSKVGFANCSKLSALTASSNMAPWERIDVETEACEIMTPFGVPVEPEVYIRYARSLL